MKTIFLIPIFLVQISNWYGVKPTDKLRFYEAKSEKVFFIASKNYTENILSYSIGFRDNANLKRSEHAIQVKNNGHVTFRGNPITCILKLVDFNKKVIYK